MTFTCFTAYNLGRIQLGLTILNWELFAPAAFLVNISVYNDLWAITATNPFTPPWLHHRAGTQASSKPGKTQTKTH